MSKHDQTAFVMDPLVRSLRTRAGWLGAAGLLVPGLALAGPTGGEVVGGAADIRTPNEHTTTIDQSSQAAIINWQTFSIDGQEFVIFKQPSSSAVALNRVIGGAPSEIFGNLLANGRVFLVNPSGVLFAPGAQLDVGGLVATTMNISDEDFMAGRYVFTSGGEGTVVNEGRITAADGGFVVLGADYVRNSGVVQARLGEVALAAGRAMTLDISGEGLVGFSVGEASVAELAGVDNLGEIQADGGTVYMSAAVARGLLGAVVNNEGRVQARSIEQGADGAIYLSADGGGLTQRGTLDAAGGTLRIGASGDIELADGSRTLAAGGELSAVAGRRLEVRRDAAIDVSTDAGGGFVELSGHGGIAMHGAPRVGRGGRLLIDPESLTVGAESGGECSFDTCYELLEGVLMQGGDVQLVASNQIDLLATADGRFDGRTGEGFGGSLLIGIGFVDGGFYRGTLGDIDFHGPSSDLFAVDGNIAILAGSEGGDIAGIVDLQAGGDIDIGAAGEVRGAGMNAGGSIEIDGAALSLGGLAAGRGGGEIALSAGGTIGAGDLLGAVAYISAGGEVSLGDAVIGNERPAYGGYYGSSFDIYSAEGGISIGNATASGPISLYAGAGDITTGRLTASGQTLTEPGNGEFLAADAVTYQYGGVGSGIDLYASGDITTLDLSASAVAEDGMAYAPVSLTAGGRIATGDLSSMASGNGGGIYASGASLALGQLQAEGAIDLYADDMLATGDLDGLGSIYAQSGGGSVSLGKLRLRGDGSADAGYSTQLYVFAHEGGIATGSIDVADSNGTATTYLEAAGEVLVGGDVAVHGSSAAPTPSYAAGLFAAYGSQVAIDGDVQISGFGDAALQIIADGAVSGGDLELTAHAIEESYSDGDDSYFERWGDAEAGIHAGGELSLGAVTLNGLDASATLIAQDLSLAGGLSLTAAGAGEGGGYYLRETRGETLLVESTAGAAGAYLRADTGDLRIGGEVSLSGPTAGLTLSAAETIEVDGNLGIAGSGYTARGDTTGLLGEDGFSGATVAALLLPPLIDEGEVAWGGAGLLIGGATLDNGAEEPSDYAGAVHIGGEVSIAGQGNVIGQVLANSLTVDGRFSTEARLGSIEGSWLEYRSIGGSTYELTRSVTGGSGEGPARFATSGIYLGLAEGDGQIGDLGAAGGDAYIQIDGGNAWSLGNIEVAGGLGEQVNDYADHSRYTALDGGPALDDTQTRILGGLSSFAVGDNGAVPAGFSAGDIAVSGTGQSILAIVSAQAATGDLSVTAAQGLLVSDDPSVLAMPADTALGDASLQLDTGSPLSAGDVSVDAALDAHVGGTLAATGPVTIAAGRRLDAWLPASLIASPPLASGANAQVHPLGVAPARADRELRPLAIDAGGEVSLAFAADSSLQALQLSGASIEADGGESTLAIAQDMDLAASGPLDLGAASFEAASIALSGETLSLAAATLTTGSLALHQFSGDLAYGDFSGERLSLHADDGSISGGDVSVGDLVVEATGNIQLGDIAVANSLMLSSGDAPGGAVQLGDIDVDGALAFEATNTDLSLGNVSAASLDIALANGEARFGHVEVGQLDVRAATILGEASVLTAESIVLAADDLLRLSGARLEADSVELSGDGLDLLGTMLTTAELSIRQFSGDFSFGDFDGSALSLRADTGSIVAGDLSADTLSIEAGGSLDLGQLSAGESLALMAGDTAGTLIRIGSLAYGGAVNFDYENAELVLGRADVATLEVALANGDAHLGELVADRADVQAANISLSGADLEVGELGLAAAGSLAIGDTRVQAGRLQLQSGGDTSVSDSELSAASLLIEAGGQVRAEGAASTLSAGGLAIDAGSTIDLAAANVQIGSGVAPLVGDPGLIDLLPEDLRPASPEPNGVFRAGGGVSFGALSIAGDHLYLEADRVDFAQAVDAPQDLFVQFSPFTAGAVLGIENSGGTRTINFTVPEHVDVFPGTTIAFGSRRYAGDIFVGTAGELDVSTRDTNFVFLTAGSITGTARNLPTNGQVVVLGGTLIDTPDGAASSIPPDPEGEVLPGEGTVLVSVIEDDEDDDLIDETSGGGDAECE